MPCKGIVVTAHQGRFAPHFVPDSTVWLGSAGAIGAFLVLGLASGCGSGRATTGGGLAVVAAENVYGDIAAQIGGAHVSVTSILSDPNADPHLFEPGTRNGLAVAQTRLVIQNGAGYDAFMTKLENAAPSSHRIVVTIADVLGVHGKDANPHLWYDVPELGRIAGAIAAGLVRADPAHAADYRAGLRRFTTSLRPLVAQVSKYGWWCALSACSISLTGSTSETSRLLY